MCAACGINTKKIYDFLQATKRLILSRRKHGDHIGSASFARAWSRSEGFGGNLTELWEMDHIVPVIEGGGMCGIDNLRTLCIRCHKKETKTLAGRRAAERRAAKDAAAQPLFREADA